MSILEISKSQKTRRSADDIWKAGLIVVAGTCFALAIVHFSVGFGMQGIKYPKDVGKDVIAYLAAAAGALALLRVGTLIKAKFAGMEFEFGTAVSEKVHRDGAELKQLALEIAEIKKVIGEAAFLDVVQKSAEQMKVTAPTLPPPSVRDDQQKNRFGGKSDVDGFSLDVRFNSPRDAKLVNLDLIVYRKDGLALENNVRFYLHETFKPDEVTVAPSNGEAAIDILAYGGFTAGAWIEGTQTLLELDLSLVRGAPHIIREL